ncbi:TrmB family transcriptional regulator [Halovivax gelatinilyticus]|uniref:TrmB family transcriptional regulator n=1 Tax=Halovivax gelatinilyticus TaxID=2961597 RepID=UPI0020CA3BCC|nr:helix-turn-helix domain-containing protein [Halovivax gelatinilyticus]
MSDLTALGLSSYEERAYRGLLSLGSASASTIAERAGIPTGRIYDVLNGLETRELVTTRPGEEPTIYVPVDPDDAVDRLLRARKRDLDRREAAYEEIAGTVRSQLAPVPPIDANVWTTDLGSEEAVALWEEQARAAEACFRLLVGPPYDEADFEAYVDELTPAARIDDGVDVRVLIADAVYSGLPDDALSSIREAAPGVEIRVGPNYRLTFDVVDDVECYVDLPDPFEPSARFAIAITRDPTVVSDLADRFDAAWEGASPVERA